MSSQILNIKKSTVRNSSESCPEQHSESRTTMTGRKDFVLWYLRQFGVKRLRRDNQYSHSDHQGASQTMSKHTEFFAALRATFSIRAAGALPQSAEDTIGRNPCVRSSTYLPTHNHYAVQCKIQTTFTHTIFLNSKFGMRLVHLKI